MTPAAVLRDLALGHRRLIAGSTLLIMLWQGCESLVPVVISVVIDRAILPQDGRAMAVWAVALAGLFLVLSMSYRFGSRLGYRAAELGAHEARSRIAEAVLHPLAVPDPARRTGETVSVAGSDTERVGMFAFALPRTFGALVSVTVTAIVVLTISVPLGLIVLGGAVVLLVLIQVLGRPLQHRSGVEQERVADTTALATDLVAGLRILRGLGAERVASGRYAAASRRSLTATVRAARAEAAYTGFTLLLTMLFLALIAFVGGRFAADGRIEVGQLVAAVGLAQFLIGPLQGLASTGALFARARASAARVAAALATARYPEPSGGAPVPCEGRVDVPGIGLEVSAGATVGVVAEPEDAARLVRDLLDARRGGLVRVDDRDVAELESAVETDVLLVAAHDAHLFAGTVADNVRAGRAGADATARAIRAADADEVVRTLPDGPDTVLTERARSLSGGQRQRVALARALAADPLVLVLHDPTTAVDGATEARIAAGLSELRHGRSTILVTTSPALLAACDTVVHLGSGTATSGSHHRLLETDDRYRELVLA